MRVYSAVVFDSPDIQQNDITTTQLIIHRASKQFVARGKAAAMLSTLFQEYTIQIGGRVA
jgi:hypothetical protein